MAESAHLPAARTRRRRHRHSIAFAIVVVLLLAAACASVWLTSPSAGDLSARVDARLHTNRGRPVALDQVAPVMRQAVVATEDERFYRHHGIDLVGVLRALPYDLAHLSAAQGASTITEQLGKILYLGGNDHSPWRKLQDAALALKLESHYSKEQLLAGYLNSAYFGHGAYGIWAASERYFGVRPGTLALPQASLLAGLIQAPSADDPVVHPEAARKRQVEVLRSLVRDGMVTGGEATAVLARPLALRHARPLPPIAGIDFAVPPAFVWWELIAGLVAIAGGVTVLLTVRWLRLEPAALWPAISVAGVVVVVFGAALAIRSFRAV